MDYLQQSLTIQWLQSDTLTKFSEFKIHLP